jgi:hypothetical protein
MTARRNAMRLAGWSADAVKRSRQVSSSRVKFCQATSSFVKASLDGGRCNFNDLS